MPSTTSTPTIQFLQEQDGKPEQILKGQLLELFEQGADLRRAYLARIKFEEQLSVALCLKTTHGPNPNLVRAIGEIFKAIFVKQEHLDILFLNETQELALRKVCSPFYYERARHEEAIEAAQAGSADGLK